MPHSVSPSGSPSQKDEEMLDAPASKGVVKVEDLFDDDDEEFPASSAPDVKMESSPAPAAEE